MVVKREAAGPSDWIMDSVIILTKQRRCTMSTSGKPGTPAKVVKPGTPAVKPGTPATKPGTPATKPGTPAVKPGLGVKKPGTPAVGGGASGASQAASPRVVDPLEDLKALPPLPQIETGPPIALPIAFMPIPFTVVEIPVIQHLDGVSTMDFFLLRELHGKAVGITRSPSVTSQTGMDYSCVPAGDAMTGCFVSYKRSEFVRVSLHECAYVSSISLSTVQDVKRERLIDGCICVCVCVCVCVSV
jgi:hypothetical protein